MGIMKLPVADLSIVLLMGILLLLQRYVADIVSSAVCSQSKLCISGI